jgi:hypothetical protein
VKEVKAIKKTGFATVLLALFLVLPMVGSSVLMIGASGDDKINLTLTGFAPLLDVYGQPAVNPDGSFYPGDQFKIDYSTTIAPDVVFSGIDAIFDNQNLEFNAGPNWGQTSGTAYFKVQRTATPNNYTVTLKAKAGESIDLGNQTDNSFTATYGEPKVDGYYITQYLLVISVDDSTKGTTSPAPESYWYNSGLDVQVTASANTNYTLNYWLLDGVNTGSSNSTTVTMDSKHTLQAVFKSATSMLTSQTEESKPLNSEPIGDSSTSSFVVHGVSSDSPSWIVKVDGAQKFYSDFPVSVNWTVGSSHSYSWNTVLSSTTSGKQYVFENVVETSYYVDSKSVTVTVVAYNPHFLVFPYLVLNGSSGSSFERPLAIMIKYLGNGPSLNMKQRAIIESFSWDGSAIKMPNSEAANTIIAYYSNVTGSVFGQVGLNSSVKAAVVKVDGTGYQYNDLPKLFAWANGTTHTFEWAKKLDSYSGDTVNPGEWFEWVNTFGSASNRTETITTSEFGSKIVGGYGFVKTLTAFAAESGVNGSYAYICNSTLPIYFNESQSFKKVLFKIDGTVARNIAASTFDMAGVENLFYTSMFCPSPQVVANVTFIYSRGGYDKSLEFTAYKWSPSGTPVNEEVTLACDAVQNNQWQTKGWEPYLRDLDDNNVLYTSTPDLSFEASFKSLPADAVTINSVQLYLYWKPHQDWWTTDVSKAEISIWIASRNHWNDLGYWGGKVSPWDANPWQELNLDVSGSIRTPEDVNTFKIQVANLNSRQFQITQAYLVVNYATDGNWTIDNSVRVEANFSSFTQTPVADLVKNFFANVTEGEIIANEIIQDLMTSTSQSFSGIGNFTGTVYSTGLDAMSASIITGHVTISGTEWSWRSTPTSLNQTLFFNFLDPTSCKIYVNLDENSPLTVTVPVDVSFSCVLNFQFPIQLGGIKNMTIYTMQSYPSGSPSTWSSDGLTQVYVEEMPPPISRADFFQFYGKKNVSLIKNSRFLPTEGYSKVYVLIEVENLWQTKFYKILPLEAFPVQGINAVADWSIVLYYLFITALNLLMIGGEFNWVRNRLEVGGWIKSLPVGRGKMIWSEFGRLALPVFIVAMIDWLNEPIYEWISGHAINIPDFMLVRNIFILMSLVFLITLGLYAVLFAYNLITQE